VEGKKKRGSGFSTTDAKEKGKKGLCIREKKK